jgi:DHA1 family multidrug resistance protein-like MFS transporter
MFLSPLQELPILGRNPVYMATLFLFVIFQIPIVTATNMSTVLAMRFMTGFFGSPALATGGASMADIFPQSQFAYVLGIWALGAVAGPITGPVIGGFAAQAKDWRWPMMELLWITSFAVVFLSLLLPETYGPTILLRRAERLRKLTGNPELRTAAEREEESKSARSVMYESLVRPFVLAKEPALAFANVYLGFVCELLFFVALSIYTHDSLQTRSFTSGSKLSHWCSTASTTSTRVSAVCPSSRSSSLAVLP